MLFGIVALAVEFKAVRAQLRAVNNIVAACVCLAIVNLYLLLGPLMLAACLAVKFPAKKKDSKR